MIRTTLGKMPEINDEVMYGDFALTVVSKTQRRVRLVSVRRVEREGSAEKEQQ